jgi:hypothetical protein
MTANVALTDTFGSFKDKSNQVIVMTQVDGMNNFIKLLDTTQSTSNTTGSIITAGGVGIAKNVTIGGSVNVHGNLHANGNITSDGSLTFGDAATDNVVFAADINSHLIPNTDDTYDLGTSSQQWGQLYLGATDSTSNTTGSIITTGGVGIKKNVTIGGNVNVHGNLHANGNITSDGSLTLGNADTDNIVLNADVNSNIIPNTDDTFDLGSSAKKWKDLYVDGVAYVDTINLNGTAITKTAAQINASTSAGDVMALAIALG